MNSSTYRCGLVFSLLMLLFIPTGNTLDAYAATSFSIHSGPFVDKIVFDVITGDDQQVFALINDDIDIIGDMIDPQYLEELEEAEHIEIANAIRNGYGYITINCAKYPFNITAFRRFI